jgi:formate-dependent nitrite reductase membrane component NrfD
MRTRSLVILLVLLAAVVPYFYLNRWLQRVIRPRENAGRLFLFLFMTFLLIVVYTGFVIGLIVKLFPVR